MQLSEDFTPRFIGAQSVKISGKITMLFAVFIMFGATIIKPQKANNFNEIINNYLSGKVKSLSEKIFLFKQEALTNSKQIHLKNKFLDIRLEYKKLSVLIEYFNPYQVKQLNGPAISRIESEVADKIIPPQGFQAIEQLLYAEWDSQISPGRISSMLDEMLVVLSKIETEPDRKFKFSKELVYDALRSAIVSVTTMGITGFDSPAALYSLPEASATIAGMQELLSFFTNPEEIIKNSDYIALNSLLEKARLFLEKQSDFNQFDRLAFIRDYINPIYKHLTETRITNKIGVPPGRNAINYEAKSIFAPDAININFYSPPAEYWVTPERVILGKKLFSDPILSGTKNRSCASCHKAELAFTDGLTKAYSLDNKKLLLRNTPTLINSGFQTKQFYDSRTDILENQLSEVVHNTEEMEGSMLQSVADLKKKPEYVTLFKLAYPNEKEPVSPFTIANTISSYVRSLQSFNSRFDRYMRGDTLSLTKREKNGFNLFTGKAKCATCHFVPLFNGLVPPAYAETESEILGVPKTKSKKRAMLDDDLGKFSFTKSVIHKYSFKTPTLRNVELTAPYMHNGVYNTLEEVMKFYNDGGGKGLKIAPEYQTLPFDRLGLSAKEIKDIISFMKSLTDTSFAK